MPKKEKINRRKHKNKLHNSLSPYLLQHAHNPVNWYPWSKEAISLAKKEDKPIFLSIGYSTCYWCHVMEREVFVDKDIAAIMNEYFINIKVDREERPDLDDIYMVARQLLTGQGGWPNNVFLTPDLRPFYAGGTYLKEDSAVMPSFVRVLELVHESWLKRRDEVEKMAQSMLQAVDYQLAQTKDAKINIVDRKTAELDLTSPILLLLENILPHYDENFGGFHGAPKFPHENYLLFLLDYHRYSGNHDALRLACNSLDKMALGGIFDHIEGGFHRYAVDEMWRVPHFEKMLYNQAELSKSYIKAYSITKQEHYKQIAVKTLDFVATHMANKHGAFFSAFDAESDEVEGKYYAFSVADLERLLTKELQEKFKQFYGIAPIPKYEGHKHPEGGALYAKNIEVFAKRNDIIAALAKARKTREKPFLDDKIITSWNGLMIEAFSFAGYILANKNYQKIAEKAAEFIMEKMDKNGMLKRIYKNGKTAIDGFLEDYAFFIKALLSLYKTSRNKKWLMAAEKYFAKAEKIFLDAQGGGYFFAKKQEDSIVRIKVARDAAIASDNSAMLFNLIMLKKYTGKAIYEEKARNLIKIFYNELMDTPISFTNFIHSFMYLNYDDMEDRDTLGIAANDNPMLSSSYVNINIEPFVAATKQGGEFKVKIKFSIAKGWHINANPSTEEFLAPLHINLDKTAKGVKLVKLDYPQGQPLNAGFSQAGTINVYKDDIIVVATLQRTGKNPHIAFTASFQACDNNVCLEAEEVAL